MKVLWWICSCNLFPSLSPSYLPCCLSASFIFTYLPAALSPVHSAWFMCLLLAARFHERNDSFVMDGDYCVLCDPVYAVHAVYAVWKICTLCLDVSSFHSLCSSCFHVSTVSEISSTKPVLNWFFCDNYDVDGLLLPVMIAKSLYDSCL